jgi:hypothetical protein
MRIYKSVIRPFLTYAAETRADNSKTKQILETTEMNTFRKTVAKTGLDHVRNQDMREQYGIQPIGEWVNKGREEWNNHISRMTEDRIVRVVRDNSPKCKRRPGRPRKRGSDSYST